MIGMPQGAEWLVILAIVVLVFGAAKLPDLARGTGQALRIFKAETKGLRTTTTTSKTEDTARRPGAAELPAGRPRRREPTRRGPPDRQAQRLTEPHRPCVHLRRLRLFSGKPVHPVGPTAGWRSRTTCASCAPAS